MSGTLQSDAEGLLAALCIAVPGLKTSVRRVDGLLPPLFPEEQTLLTPSAVKKRRREFHAGRVAARDCIKALGLAVASIGKHANRAPKWPAGVTGSISHSDKLAVAIVKASQSPIGIDLEMNEQLPDDIAEVVATAEEQHAMQFIHSPGVSPGRVVFSAKESVYKAISLQVGRVVDFSEVSITRAPIPNAFHAIAKSDLSGRSKPGRIVANGCHFTSDHHILTYAQSMLDT